MNKMISTELGFSLFDESAVDWSNLPSSENLEGSDLEEFSDPNLLTAQARLCLIKSKALETASRGFPAQSPDAACSAVQPCLDMLQEWRDSLPPYLSFTFADGLDPKMVELPFVRILASLYLRYHQVSHH